MLIRSNETTLFEKLHKGLEAMYASASLFPSFSNSDDIFANTGVLSESKRWCRIYQLMQISGKRSDYVQIFGIFKMRGLAAGNRILQFLIMMGSINIIVYYVEGRQTAGFIEQLIFRISVWFRR